jgi:transcriptional regulator with XRE-family HTH domain
MLKKRRRVSKETKPYLAWLRAGLAKRGKTNKGLAAVLGVGESAVSRMVNGSRRIRVDELQTIAAYIDEPVPGREANNERTGNDIALSGAHSVPLVRVSAVIAPGVWRDISVALAITDRVPGSPDRRIAGMKQYACKIEADPNRHAICVPFAEIRNKPMQNDVVHVRRTTGDRYEDTLRVVHVVGAQIKLVAEGLKGRDATLSYPSNSKTEAIEIKGLVVGYFNSTGF